MKKIFKYLIVFIIMIITFCTTLTLTSMIPKKNLEKKVAETSEILNKETNDYYVPIIIKNIYVRFDNYSDALMINTAYSINNKTPFYSAMMARRNYIEGKTEIINPDEAGNLKFPSKYATYTPVGELSDTVSNNITESYEYARYWHGYLLVLRPLLMILNITQIRTLFSVIFFILGGILLYKLYKKFNIQTAIIFFLGLLISDYFYISNSIHGLFVYLIATIASIILLSREVKDIPMFFLILGCLACFFDLLTVPVITLGIPLLIYILIKNKEELSFKLIFIEIIKCCILWAIGYFGIYISKWVIVDLLYNKGLIQTSINQFVFRTNNKGYIEVSFSEILRMNLIYTELPFKFSIILIIIMSVINLIKSKSLKNINLNFNEIFSYVIIGCIGLCWYYVFKQHSCQHAFFTYRILWVISTGLLLAIYNLFKVKCEKKEEVKEESEK